ncbi:unnamed protein product [Ceratitis capitata]|uniref:(Mediterranean fruit fly) hypothetical protein n=1 Tax=Ceratitis capitata TaxID=7213 RepID=A0A811UJ18_CERCA|nr:unnamed protein product [Ceratitis capitata]
MCVEKAQLQLNNTTAKQKLQKKFIAISAITSTTTTTINNNNNTRKDCGKMLNMTAYGRKDNIITLNAI